MAFSKIIAESMDLTDTFNFTGTLQQNGGSIGETNIPYFDVKPSSNNAYSDNTSHTVILNTVNKDTASGFNNSTYKYTVQSGQAGQYVINYGFRMNPTNCTRASLGLKLNDSTVQTVETDGGGGSTYASACSSILITLAVSDVLHLVYEQNSSVNSVLRTDGTYLSGFKLTSTT